MTSRLLPYTLILNPCATFLDLTTDEISLIPSANPDHRFSSLGISRKGLSASSRTCSSKPALETPARTFLDMNLLCSLSRYYEGVKPPELIHSDSFRGIYAHSLRSVFNNFSSVESFRLCAPPTTTVLGFSTQDNN